MRVDDLEFRRNGSDRDPEIVAFFSSFEEKEYCYTLLFWKKGREGWEIEFVGDRPLSSNFSGDIMKMMKYGQAVLNAEFELQGEW
jgi:hypothetical protein